MIRCLNGKDNVDYALMLPLDPESHDSISFVEIYVLILDMWKKTSASVPFCKCKICVFGFFVRVMIFL